MHELRGRLAECKEVISSNQLIDEDLRILLLDQVESRIQLVDQVIAVKVNALEETVRLGIGAARSFCDLIDKEISTL